MSIRLSQTSKSLSMSSREFALNNNPILSQKISKKSSPYNSQRLTQSMYKQIASALVPQQQNITIQRIQYQPVSQLSLSDTFYKQDHKEEEKQISIMDRNNFETFVPPIDALSRIFDELMLEQKRITDQYHKLPYVTFLQQAKSSSIQPHLYASNKQLIIDLVKEIDENCEFLSETLQIQIRLGNQFQQQIFKLVEFEQAIINVLKSSKEIQAVIQKIQLFRNQLIIPLLKLENQQETFEQKKQKMIAHSDLFIDRLCNFNDRQLGKGINQSDKIEALIELEQEFQSKIKQGGELLFLSIISEYESKRRQLISCVSGFE